MLKIDKFIRRNKLSSHNKICEIADLHNNGSKISIIMPVYNTEQYLRKTLESLTNQTYKNIEILCIDDGSHDDSLSILEEYAKADSRMRVFRQENKGPAAARNLGLDNMTGEYLMFCDSDDWYEPDMCEKMLFAITSENVDVACCRTNLHFIEKDKRVRERYFNNRNFSDKKNLDDYYIIKTNVLLWNKIFKTDIINKYKIRFPEGLLHEDDAFWYMYAICVERIYYLPEKLYNYVVRSGSITRNGLKQIVDTDRLGICSYLYQFLKNNNLLDGRFMVLRKIFNLQLKIS